MIKVALAILCVHKDSLMACDDFEALSDYLKYKVPLLNEQQIQSIIQTASQTNLSRCILEYDVEFHLIQEEVLHSPQQCQESDRKDFNVKNDLEQQISALKSQNQHLQLEIQNLQEQLQVIIRSDFEIRQYSENDFESESHHLCDSRSRTARV